MMSTVTSLWSSKLHTNLAEVSVTSLVRRRINPTWHRNVDSTSIQLTTNTWRRLHCYYSFKPELTYSVYDAHHCACAFHTAVSCCNCVVPACSLSSDCSCSPTAHHSALAPYYSTNMLYIILSQILYPCRYGRVRSFVLSEKECILYCTCNHLIYIYIYIYIYCNVM